MPQCQPRVDGAEYWSEAWWSEGFRTLDEAYSRLMGFIEARGSVIGMLSGDLSNLLKDANLRDFTLKVILGGFRDECLNNPLDAGKVGECFNRHAIGRFYREVLGIGLTNEDLSELVIC